jgi:hypothetical protein
LPLLGLPTNAIFTDDTDTNLKRFAKGVYDEAQKYRIDRCGMLREG